MSFLEMSLMGGAMILCILLLRMFSRGRLPGIVLSTMWAAALLRLLVPVEIPSVLSIAGLVRGAVQPTVMTSPALPTLNTVPIPPLVFVWLCGVALCAFFFLLMGIRQRRVLKTALPATMTPELKAALIDQRLPRKVAVYFSDRISTPLTYGINKPRIVLPSHLTLGKQELNFVIAHECGHILRRDALKKRVLLFAVCLHWFNPLVWLMADVCRRDMELDCDRRVLKKCGHKARANYARTLLDLEERKRFSGMLMECLSVSPLETRIRSIMAGKKSSIAGALAAMAAYVCVAAVFATSPGTMPTVMASSIWITAVPLKAYDARQMSAAEAAVYVMSSNVLEAGQTGLRLVAPYVMAGGQLSQEMSSVHAASVSVKYGGTIAVASDDVVVPAIAVPAYSMAYALKDTDIQH